MRVGAASRVPLKWRVSGACIVIFVEGERTCAELNGLYGAMVLLGDACDVVGSEGA